MRKNFAEVLKENKINIRLEYDKLYSILYNKNIWLSNGQFISLHDLINSNFMAVTFRKTCLSLDEFDEVNGFRFIQFPQDVDLEMLVNISEYIWNMLQSIQPQITCSYPPLINVNLYYQQIHAVIESIGYSIQNQNGYIIFVPKDNVAISVAESTIIPENISYKVIEYNHHSIKGDIEAKKGILLKLAELLEPKRKDLSNQLGSDLFFLINNFNIRHNNTDPGDKSKYKSKVAEMPADELEHIYDEVYQMCLLAFMELEHAERKEWIAELKKGNEG